jgi:hypothetical protein
MGFITLGNECLTSYQSHWFISIYSIQIQSVYTRTLR